MEIEYPGSLDELNLLSYRGLLHRYLLTAKAHTERNNKLNWLLLSQFALKNVCFWRQID